MTRTEHDKDRAEQYSAMQHSAVQRQNRKRAQWLPYFSYLVLQTLSHCQSLSLPSSITLLLLPSLPLLPFFSLHLSFLTAPYGSCGPWTVTWRGVRSKESAPAPVWEGRCFVRYPPLLTLCLSVKLSLYLSLNLFFSLPSFNLFYLLNVFSTNMHNKHLYMPPGYRDNWQSN